MVKVNLPKLIAFVYVKGSDICTITTFYPPFFRFNKKPWVKNPVSLRIYSQSSMMHHCIK